MDRKILVAFRPYFYIYPAHFYIYGKIQKWEGKRKGGVSRPYLRDPVFSRDNPVLVPYL